MEELFGLSMNALMIALLAIFLVAMAIVAVLAWRNRIMLKLGLRNIPRRRTQTVLIIIGVMLSTLIISAAFGTGDTISFSIRNEVVKSLKTIDEIIVSERAGSDDSFGSAPYVPFERFEQLQGELAGLNSIDGLAPQVAETVPVVNLRTSLSEGRMRVVGVAPALLDGFGAFTLISGEEVRLEELAHDEVYINDEAGEEIEAVAGDELRMFAGEDTFFFKVRGVINRGGLAGRESTLLMPLERAQSIFGRAGQINLMVVSNRGDEVAGADLSEEVTRELRVLFTDREVAFDLKVLLNQEGVLKALKKREESLSGNIQKDVARLRNELKREKLSDELISLLADEGVSSEVLEALEQDELREVEREASTFFAELGEFRVLDVKRDFLDEADEAGSITTTFFITFSMFSIMVGILLIFLIFVMLAAARRSEMGMARAVGAKRRHLIQMFVFEGTAYALVSAAVGVLLGLGISALMVALINRIIVSFDVDFRFITHFTVRSAIVAYCLGMVITFATVAFSAYRVSRLNIVVAIRGLPEALVLPAQPSFLTRFLGLPRAMVRPLIFALRGLTSLLRLRFVGFLSNTGLAILWAVLFPIWIGDIAVAVLRFIWPYLIRGWLTFLLGLLLTLQAISAWERISLFGGGVSLMIVGLGLLLRTGLRRTSMRADVRDRIAFTFMGVVILVFWALPMDFFERVTGELQGDFHVMFVSGIAMVAAAVWVLMYNADLLLRALTFFTARIGKLRPILVTAVAYPMSAKFRTGLTLAMFALVIFTLVVMSILTEIFSTQFEDVETVTGKWDIQGTVSFNTPVEDMRQSIDEEPGLRSENFDAIGGYTQVDIQWRQVGADNQRWHRTGVWAANDDFLVSTGHKFKLIADGYGTTDEAVWQGLRSNPGLAVLGGSEVRSRPGSDDEWRDFNLLEGVYYNDENMSPVDIEVREPHSGAIVPLTVIGVLDRVHENSGAIITSKTILDKAIPYPVPITNYQFRVAEGVDTKQVARSLEASFQEHGMETEVLEEVLEREVAAGRAFSSIFTGFMGLGLLVGIAALGVVSTRAVVERRQQIGVLRAIGYRRRMVQLSFLLEFSFVALLGIAIGVILGTILGYNAFRDIRQEEGIDTIRFSIPWLQIGIIVTVAYLFSLVTTFLPARQASRIYPAEALRYE